MNILIVEDDAVIADAIGITLSQAGYHHVHTKTIEEAPNSLASIILMLFYSILIYHMVMVHA